MIYATTLTTCASDASIPIPSQGAHALQRLWELQAPAATA